MSRLTYLQCKQALVDLGSLQSGLSVGAGRVRPSLVPCQVYEGELSMHLTPSPQDDLEHSVAPRGVSVSRGLTGSPEKVDTSPSDLCFFPLFHTE